jgi:pimeloyl-ACP methyl ester carboxylesterase
MPHEELVMPTAGVPIAVRDYGGAGPAALVLHGAGGNLVTVDAFARELASRLRVVAVDLRGHGHSGDGPWEWPVVLRDLEAVRDEIGLRDPAVVGWSLGGMIAAMWAERHPECPAAVSLDGTPPPSRPDQCPGLPPDRAGADLDRLHAAFTAIRTAQSRAMTQADLDAALAAQLDMARRHGAAADMATAAFERNLTTRAGQTWIRPLPETLAALQTAINGLDVIPIYRAARCRLMIALATEHLREQRRFQDLYAAYRRDFDRRLGEATGANSALHVVRVEGTSHAMVAERPAALAKLVGDFACLN